MMKFLKKNLLFIVYLLIPLFLVIAGFVSAATFPGSLNNFSTGDTIEAIDWNAIEARLGITGSASTTSLTYQVDRIMATTSLPQLSTIGTITTGIWNGTTVTVPYGGSGAVSFTSNGVLYGNGTGALQVTAACSNGQVLKWSGGVPACGTDDNSGGTSGANFGKTFELNAANSLG